MCQQYRITSIQLVLIYSLSAHSTMYEQQLFQINWVSLPISKAASHSGYFCSMAAFERTSEKGMSDP